MDDERHDGQGSGATASVGSPAQRGGEWRSRRPRVECGAERLVWVAERSRPKARGGEARPVVVVVDDDPLVRRSLTRRLSRDFEVHAVPGVQAARRLTQVLPRVDLALVDLELPDGRGEQLLADLGGWPDAILVVMSANPARLADLSAGRERVHLVLQKPIVARTLDALGKAALGLRKG